MSVPKIEVQPTTGSIVVFKDSVVNALVTTNSLANRFNFSYTFVFEHCIKGFAAFNLPRATIDHLTQTSVVDHVENDIEIEAAGQTVSWAFKRLGATESPTLDYVNKRDLSSVHVFVLDTGIDFNNPDIRFVSTDRRTFVTEGRRGTDGALIYSHSANDIHGHGTSVAGIIAARNEATTLTMDFKPLSTVAGMCPGANVHSYKVLNNGGKGYMSFALAALEAMIRWTLVNPLEYKVVANLSFTAFTGSEDYTALDTAIQKMVNHFFIPVVVAAGNYTTDAAYFSPAHSHEAYTVGAYDIKNNLCEFSNFGDVIDFLAPGDRVLTTGLNGTCMIASGTSIACAHVAGAVCLERQKNPTKTPTQIKNTLLSYASQNPRIQVPYASTTTLSVYVRDI